MARLQKGDYLDVADFVSPETFSDDAEEQPLVPQRLCGRRSLPALAVVSLLAGLACVYTLRARHGEHLTVAQAQSRPSTIALQGKPPVDMDELAVAAADLALSGPGTSDNASASAHEAPDLKPPENLHDGNLCEDNEEELGGLCYKQCGILTMGEAPIRTSPWTCCESHPCGLSNQRGSVGATILCKGYDISGSGSCPHKPGACLKNEEMFLGVCYKLCSLLTKDEYPNRVGPATCCKANGVSCLDVLYHDKTRADFAVGGGKGDHDASTPALPHPPQVNLTEEGGRANKDGAAADLQTGATAALASDGSVLKPTYDRHDGNKCEDQEESFGGLCYKKCSLLTGGDNPIRTSPWTCCESHPCGLSNQKGTVGHEILCDGFDVSADGSCPHKPGACLKDEELFMGICYKKCMILTNGNFPNRVTPVSCCTDQGVNCFDISKVRNRLAYAVGGGKGDNDPSTPALIHAPQVALTEARRLQR